ncbi:hypothetical protein [Commensalibacter papalotli (ex Servin-Garciduenas et al. 2014)]|uniref:Uncharacterized protein n=1 Tax=Commensalibacter papalotli (ex Servin-Garciduenas et al. 2014) TaxID=1208583 RepID=W7E0R9_9PROT|nr:hypothetical protein [Commensalibacter papalotli (ex Servin-Garciduenas et al. 2014)]EUK18604.1 hypothetical protein COMX_02610 [Commensalibacter papalotli (ex Servin-Garciduenas et al. 2014)]
MQFDNQFNYHISNLKILADYLYDVNSFKKEVSLISYILAYDDEILLAERGYFSISSEQVYIGFYNYLQNWILKSS